MKICQLSVHCFPMSMRRHVFFLVLFFLFFSCFHFSLVIFSISGIGPYSERIVQYESVRIEMTAFHLVYRSIWWCFVLFSLFRIVDILQISIKHDNYWFRFVIASKSKYYFLLENQVVNDFSNKLLFKPSKYIILVYGDWLRENADFLVLFALNFLFCLFVRFDSTFPQCIILFGRLSSVLWIIRSTILVNKTKQLLRVYIKWVIFLCFFFGEIFKRENKSSVVKLNVCKSFVNLRMELIPFENNNVGPSFMSVSQFGQINRISQTIGSAQSIGYSMFVPFHIRYKRFEINFTFNPYLIKIKFIMFVLHHSIDCLCKRIWEDWKEQVRENCVGKEKPIVQPT